MKKTFVVLTSILLMCIMLIGCTEGNITLSTSKELSKNLNILSNAVKRLDTVDNDYLINDDLYAVEEISTESNKINGEKLSNITILANNNGITDDSNLTAEKITIKDDLKEALKDEIISRLYCDENGNCKLCGETFICDNDGTCNSCNETIICDENGNCTSCGSTLFLNENNACNSCNKTCISSKNNNKIPSNISNKLVRISSDNKELVADKICYTNLDENNTLLQSEKFEEDIDDIDNNNTFMYNKHGIYDNRIRPFDNLPHSKPHKAKLQDLRNIDKTSTSENNVSTLADDENFTNDNNILEENNATENNENSSSIRIIYLSEQTLQPDAIGYSPRYIQDVNSKALSNSLENYLNKVQKLYTMTADVLQANNDLLAKRDLILDTINETKALNKNIENGTYAPTENQVDALKNYIIDIKATVKNIRNCNGELTNEINKISNENNGLSQSIDVISSNYLKILNQLDTRISYHDNAIATLEQIKNILEENYNNYLASQTPDNDIVTDDENQDLNDNTNDDVIVDTPATDDDGIDSDIDTDASDVIIIVEENNDTNLDNNVEGNDSENVANDESSENEIISDDNVDNVSEDNVSSDMSHENILVDENVSTETDVENNVVSDDVIVENNGNDNSNISNETQNNQSTNVEDNENSNENDTPISSTNNTSTENEEHTNETVDDTENASNKTVDDYNFNSTLDEPTTLEIKTQSVDSEHIKSNIDTYQNSTLGYTNIDTLNNGSFRHQENIGSSNNTNNLNDNISNNTDDIVSNNNEANLNDGIVSDDNILNNNVANNGTLYNNGNLSNGNLYSNSIINDNNIGENDLGNISYRYDENGHLYNNTNGFNSAGINNQNINNNNVNTYKYNTMVDTINRGTVNNGINKL